MHISMADKKPSIKARTENALRALRKKAQRAYVAGDLDTALKTQMTVINESGVARRASDYKLMGLYLFSARRFEEAAEIMKGALARFPDDAEMIQNIGSAYTRARQDEEAVKWLRKALKLRPEHANIHDGLANTYSQLGKHKQARKHGRKSLELKARQAEETAPLVKIGRKKPPKFDPAARHRNVIGFSLWGADDKYLASAIENARLAPHLYPEWTARFYVDDTVPDVTIAELLSHGADVMRMPKQKYLFEGLFWRFRPAFEKNVDYFLVRDADSLLNVRERAAVTDWLDSGRHFHLMRDYFTHTDLILAGMWGGVGGILPDLEKHWQPYLEDAKGTMTRDQTFLAGVIWPVVRQSVLIHDGVFGALGAKPFPAHAAMREGFHVGQNALPLMERRQPAGRMSAGGTEPDKKAAAARIKTRKQLVFTLTTGRSGTGYLSALLAANLKDAEVLHEATGYQNFGVATPDASTNMLFNSAGNVRAVRRFWQKKFALIRQGRGETYVETSHFLAKAGLLENLIHYDGEIEAHILCLQRDPLQVVRSLVNRHDFANLGFTWLFALDPRYPRNILGADSFMKAGLIGTAYWYVAEMACRTAYYKRLFAPIENIHLHEITLDDITGKKGAAALLKSLNVPVKKGPALPKPANTTKEWRLGPDIEKRIEKMIANNPFNPQALAEGYLRRGRRIG